MIIDLTGFVPLKFPKGKEEVSGHLIHHDSRIYSISDKKILEPRTTPYYQHYTIPLNTGLFDKYGGSLSIVYDLHELVAATFIPNPDNLLSLMFHNRSLDKNGCHDPAARNLSWFKMPVVADLPKRKR